MSKEVTFNPMEKMLVGFNKAANAVTGTLGPCGRNVFIDDAMTPKITNDGATIAQNIILEDKIENMGAYLIRNTSSQTNDDAGDGTTTTAVLLQAIVHECMKRTENPMFIKNELKASSENILAQLKKRAQKIETKDIHRVAEISAENKELAKMITDIIHKVGEKAVITVEDSRDFKTDYEIVEGYEAPVGFMSPVFITDAKKSRAVMTDVAVLCCEKKIASVSDIAPIFEQFKKAGINQAVVVCEDIENSMLGVLVNSKMVGSFNSIVIKATGQLLEDISEFVGATRVSDQTGITFQNIDLQLHVGKAKKVVSNANRSLFIADGGNGENHARKLEKDAVNEHNQYIKKRLIERTAKLRGGVAVLRIGAPTDFERDYLRLKAEDAVKAVQAALEEGIVEGGGMTLWRIAQTMKPKTVGEIILKNALQAPLRKICENAGKDYTEIVSTMPTGYGYDARNDKHVDMLAEGIIDPAKVERCALENAVSSASTFITTFACISDYVAPNKA